MAAVPVGATATSTTASVTVRKDAISPNLINTPNSAAEILCGVLFL
jgi:hypothetical protein